MILLRLLFLRAISICLCIGIIFMISCTILQEISILNGVFLSVIVAIFIICIEFRIKTIAKKSNQGSSIVNKEHKEQENIKNGRVENITYNVTDEEILNALFKWEQINTSEWGCVYLGTDTCPDIHVLHNNHLSNTCPSYTIDGIKFNAWDAHYKYGFSKDTTIVNNYIGEIEILQPGFLGIKHLKIPIPKQISALAHITSALVKGEMFARINYSDEVIQDFSQQILEKHKALQKEEQKRIEQEEEQRLKEKIKARQARRELEKKVRQQLIDSGELFGEETKRPKIPREVVDAIYRRDGGRCVYCGSTDNLQLDHIIPFSRGGATSIENLQLLCQKCNLEKSNKIG